MTKEVFDENIELSRARLSKLESQAAEITEAVSVAQKAHNKLIFQKNRWMHLQTKCAAKVFRDYTFTSCSRKIKSKGLCGIHVKRLDCVEKAAKERAAYGIETEA